MGITTAEFNERRGELIRIHEENAGLRGFGREVTEKKIAALLGFTDESCNGYWEGDKIYLSSTADDGSLPQFPCPVKKPYARTSYVHIRRCPAGLFSPVLEIKFGKTWRLGRQRAEEPRLSWPEVQANNALRTAFHVVVYDSFKEAAFAAIDEANRWFGEEKANLFPLLNLVQNGAELPDSCPLTDEQVRRSWQTIIEIQLWLRSLSPEVMKLDAEYSAKGLAVAGGESGLAVVTEGVAIEPITERPALILPPEREDDAVDVEFSKDENPPDAGQQRLAGEDVMPTSEPVTADPELLRVKDKYDEIRLKVQTEKQAIKEIKEEALAPHKNEISEKESAIELMSFVMTLFEVQAAKAEAKIKSKYEDPTFCVYAYTLTGFKGVRVQVGTKQDIRDIEHTHDGVHSYVIAEFLDGEDVTDREE